MGKAYQPRQFIKLLRARSEGISAAAVHKVAESQINPRQKKLGFSTDDPSDAKAQSYTAECKRTRQRLMGPYNVQTQWDPTPPVYIHCIASNGVGRSQNQHQDKEMWDLSLGSLWDLSGISLPSGPPVAHFLHRVLLETAPGSLWDLSGISLPSGPPRVHFLLTVHSMV